MNFQKTSLNEWALKMLVLVMNECGHTCLWQENREALHREVP